MAPTTTEQRDARAAVEAAAGGASKRAYVRDVFETIAPSYDLLNHLLSLNIDRVWRRHALRSLGWEQRPGGCYVDLCAGTMDVTAALAAAPAFSGTIVAADFAEAMLRVGRGKERNGRAHPVVADALRLPLRDGSADGIIVAFGARNLTDLGEGLREARRVLRPGGRFVILEFTTPRSRLVRALYHLYFRRILPFVGGIISGHRSAYRYLPESVAHFPPEQELAERMRAAGFVAVAFRSLTLGIAAIHTGQR